ncbi:hypothetical protein A5789_24930 [Nocardia sp. 852002-51101_SCH5132738]|nr:hypothetical protein A5789_24930 [Nocardia sp. 852002-51101_SCH5132738]
MPNRYITADLGPQITAALTELAALALSMTLDNTPGGRAEFSELRVKAEDARELIGHLHELLEIQTAGGGPEAEGFTAADPRAVGTAVRQNVTRAVVQRLAFRDPAGSLHIIGEQYASDEDAR